ncbi:MAG: glycerate kinase, partial [Acidimicrobiales bacterium]
MRVLAAPDKFRGTASAPDVATAIARAVAAVGGTADEAPLADGGEGTLQALGGANRTTTVTGPLGDPVVAEWRLDRRSAVIEMAQASGLEVVGGPEGNDAVAASTYGTGELIAAAVERGAREIVVAVGGSATTDGGLGALRALEP